MATQTPFFDLWRDAQNKGLTPGKEKAAREWMRKTSRNIKIGKQENPIDFIRSQAPQFKRRQIYPGFLYTWEYDAKLKDDPKALPYWDRNPLTFIMEIYEDGFSGINLHYLNRPMRGRLMDALYTLSTNKKYNDNQRLALSYGILKSSAKFRWFKPCYKRYLSNHVRSPFYKIPSESWDSVLFLDSERFVRKPKTYVWAESAKIIRSS